MKKIFVVGCPRSGTTLIQTILGSHDNIYTCKETHFFQRIRRVGKSKVLDYLVLSQNRILEWYELFSTHNELLKEYNLNRVKTPRSAVVFLDQFMTSEANARAKSAWVEKTPSHLFYVPWIKRYIPSAQIVHIIRDGRDVVASLVDAARRFPHDRAWKKFADLDVAINVYNRYLKESSKYIGKKDHIFVDYEQVVEDAEKASHSLFAQLGMNVGRIDLELNKVHKQVVGKNENWKDSHDGLISDTRLIKFNRMFDSEQRQFIAERVAKFHVLS